MTDIHIGTPTECEVKNRDGTTRQAWVVSYKDLRGKRRRVYAADLPAMQRKVKQLEAELQSGQHNATRASFEQVAQEALAERSKMVGKKNGLRQQTWANDERHIRLHLQPYFGASQIRSLTTGKINTFIGHMLEGEIAPKTQRHIINTLNMVCKHAVDRGYIYTNPCAKEDRKQVRGAAGRRGAYNADELRQLLAQDMTLYVRSLIMTAAWTGLAANELQGLQWRDVDLYAGTLSVGRTGYRYMVQDETKTEYRQRTIPIPSATIKVLREWQLQSDNAVWVFPTVSGRMGEQNAWRKLVATVCRHAGIDDKGLGGFRKFYHTQMETAGVPKSIRNFRMGHSVHSNTGDMHYTEAEVKRAQDSADLEALQAQVLP